MEEDINALDAATAAAADEGLEVFSSPGILEELYVRVLQLQGVAITQLGNSSRSSGHAPGRNPFSRIHG